MKTIANTIECLREKIRQTAAGARPDCSQEMEDAVRVIGKFSDALDDGTLMELGGGGKCDFFIQSKTGGVYIERLETKCITWVKEPDGTISSKEGPLGLLLVRIQP